MPKQVKDLINSYTLRKRVVSFGCENLCITETYRNYRHPGICCHCSFRSACSTCSSKVCCNQPLQPVRDIWSRQVRNVMCKLAKYIKIPQCLGWCSQTSGLSLSSFFITTAYSGITVWLKNGVCKLHRFAHDWSQSFNFGGHKLENALLVFYISIYFYELRIYIYIYYIYSIYIYIQYIYIYTVYIYIYICLIVVRLPLFNPSSLSIHHRSGPANLICASLRPSISDNEARRLSAWTSRAVFVILEINKPCGLCGSLWQLMMLKYVKDVEVQCLALFGHMF